MSKLRTIRHLLVSSSALVWTAAPRQFAMVITLQFAAGSLMGVQLLVIRNLIHAVVSAGAGTAPAMLLVPSLLALIGTQTAVNLSQLLENHQQQLLAELVGRNAGESIVAAAARAELRTFEMPDFHDQLRRAHTTAVSRPVMTVNSLTGILRNTMALGGMSIGLYLLAPVLLIFMLATFLPLALGGIVTGRSIHRFTKLITHQERKRDYILELVTSPAFAKEVRAYDLGAYLKGAYRDLTDARIDRLRRELSKRLATLVGTAGAAALISAGGLAVLTYLVIVRQIGVSEAAAAAAALIQIRVQLSMLAAATTSIYESTLFVGDLETFKQIASCEGPPGPRQPDPERFEVIEARAVFFKYPSSTPTNSRAGHRAGSRCLEDVSIRVRKGEFVALVGENGSGKSTLAKLLCGLYAPDTGQVLWNGLDIREVNSTALRKQIAVMFQDFGRYMLTARENIAFGDIGQIRDTHRIESAALRAGAHDLISHWEKAYETVLGPVFQGGTEPSLGQWQRLALARAFFRDAALIVLDEPAASLDPRSEYRLYQAMQAFLPNRGILLISHRLSSVRMADRIYVLEAGRIIEEGSHIELLRNNGLYAELHRLQTHDPAVGSVTKDCGSRLGSRGTPAPIH